MKREEYIDYIMMKLDKLPDKLVELIYWLIRCEFKKGER